MAILYIENKRWLSTRSLLFIVLLVLATALVLVLYSRRDAPAVKQGVRLAAVETPSLMAYPNVSENVVAMGKNTGASLRPVRGKEKPADSNLESRLVPAYGMAALGSKESAWDVKKDPDGNLCRDPEELTTPDLVRLFRQGRGADPCSYADALVLRQDFGPNDIGILQYVSPGKLVLTPEHILNFAQSGLWLASDYERLAGIPHNGFASVLYFYFALRKVGSPRADAMYQYASSVIEPVSDLQMFIRSGKTCAEWINNQQAVATLC